MRLQVAKGDSSAQAAFCRNPAFGPGGFSAAEVLVTDNNPISEEALATLPPGYPFDFTGERAVWEGKFCIG